MSEAVLGATLRLFLPVGPEAAALDIPADAVHPDCADFCTKGIVEGRGGIE